MGRRIFESNHAAKGDAGCLNRLASVALCLTADDERAAAGSDRNLLQCVQIITQPLPLHLPATTVYTCLQLFE